MSDQKAMYQTAFEAFVRQDYDASVAAYQELIATDPRFALAHQGLAEV